MGILGIFKRSGRTGFKVAIQCIKSIENVISNQKMIFLFYFAGLVASRSLSLSSSQLLKYETKLRKYQNLTNIDEATFQEIWAIGSQNSKSFFQIK